jgi:hypothetical protein
MRRARPRRSCPRRRQPAHAWRAPDRSPCSRTFARPAQFAGGWIDAPRDAAGYAHDLYANLRALDATGAAVILIEAVPNDAEVARRPRSVAARRGDDDIATNAPPGLPMLRRRRRRRFVQGFP